MRFGKRGANWSVARPGQKKSSPNKPKPSPKPSPKKDKPKPSKN